MTLEDISQMGTSRVEELALLAGTHTAVGGVAAALRVGAVHLEVRQGGVAAVVAHVAGAGVRAQHWGSQGWRVGLR